MIMKANKQIGFIYKNNESIDKIFKEGEVVFERGFLREKTSTTLPITFGGVGKNLKDYKIYGNTYQNSTSGKNLLDDKNMTARLRCTVDNGVITTTPLARASTFYVNINDIPLKAGDELYTTFKVRLKSGNASRLGYGGRLYDGTTYATNTNVTPSTVSDEFVIYSIKQTATTDIIANQMVFQAENVVGVSDAVYEIKDIIVSTNPIDTYEEYTGGQPSPNPDYPQEMVSCGDRAKNLFDVTKPYANENLSAAGVTLTFNDDGTITANGTNNASYKYIRFDISLEAGTYYFSGCPSDGSNNGYSIIVQTGSGSSSQIFDTGEGATFTLTEKKTIQFFPVRVGSSTVTFNNMIFKPIIAKVPVTYANYEPYGYKIPVNVRSKNLFDKDNANIINAFLYNNKCSIREDYGDRTLILLAKPNTTYTVSRSVTTPTFRVAYTNNDLPTATSTRQDVNVEGQITDENASSITITTGNLVKYLLVCYGHTRDTNINESLASIQIEEGSIATNYQPYYNETTNIYLDEPLRKIGEYSDYIDFINGKTVRNIEEIVLDGNENWFINGSGTDRWFYYVNNLTKNTPSDNGKYIISSHYIGNAIYSSNTNKGIVATKSSKELRIRYGTEDTIVNFKTWLQSNNVTVDYVLSTPTEESITLPNIPTVDGNNTLNIETELTPSQVYIKYKSNT